MKEFRQKNVTCFVTLWVSLKNTFKYGDSWAWLVTTYCQVTWNQIHLLHLSSNLTWDFFKIILSEFETKSNSKRHTIWLTVTDSSHKVSTIKSLYINVKRYLFKDLSKNLIKYTNSLLARVKCECYSTCGSPSNALQARHSWPAAQKLGRRRDRHVDAQLSKNWQKQHGKFRLVEYRGRVLNLNL